MMAINIEFAPRSENQMRYDEAILYCAFCAYGGHRDWRMPTFDELFQSDYLYVTNWTTVRHSIGKLYITPVRDI